MRPLPSPSRLTAAAPALLSALLAVACGSTPAQAINVVNAGGFESPTFTAGNLAGQQNWLVPGGTSSSATVQSAVKESGQQAVRVDRAANSDGRWAVPVTGFPTGRFITIDWDMRVDQTVSAAFGPFFGVEAYGGDGSIIRVGMLGVDASTGELLYGDRASGLIPTPGGETASFGQWHSYQIVLDFFTDAYAGYVNGNLVVSTNFEFTGADEFTDADIAALAASFDAASQSLTGTAYFDNFLVRDGLPGDYNNNGVVDAADYTVWRDLEGQTGYGLAADGDANGVVDQDDYDLWASLFGADNDLAVAVATPEPSAALLCVAATSFCSLGARRRR